MQLVSRANRREHWRTTKRRNDAQIHELELLHGAKLRAVQVPAAISLIRIAPRQLDAGDNLEYAFKHIRDYIANQLVEHTQANQHGTRGDDSDERLTWRYGQRKGEYGVEVLVDGS